MKKRRGPRGGGGPPSRRPPRRLPLPPRFAGPASSVGSVIPLSLALEGDSALGASLVAVRPLSVTMQGSGAIAASPLIAVRPLSSGLVGDGSLASSPLVARRTLSLGFVGDGSLTPALVAQRPLSVSLAGSGALTASIGALRLLSIGLSGGGTLTGSAVVVKPLAVQLQGSGALAARISPPSLTLALSGSGSMSVDLVNANMPGGATEPASYRPRYGRIYPAIAQPPAPKPFLVEEVAWDDDFVELEPLPPIGAVSMRGSGALDVVLSVLRPLPAAEPAIPARDVFPWWEHPTEEEIAFILAIA